MSLVKINTAACNLSYNCVRICPVKAIEVKADQEFPHIIDERCIDCGSCITACGRQAIEYRNDVDAVKSLLSQKKSVAALIAPEISAEFGDVTDYRKLSNMIKQLGFRYVLETSFGVDLIARQYHELFTNFKGKYYITANCPAVVAFVLKYHPGLTDNLAPIASPMDAMAKVARSRFGADVRTVFIGSCIAAKSRIKESLPGGEVDIVLTFQELRQLFSEFNITETSLEFSDLDEPLGRQGALYPLSNGIIQAAGITEELTDSPAITSEGRENTIAALQSFEDRLDVLRHHFNLFYCEGCMTGPGMTGNTGKFIRKAWVIDYARKRLSLPGLETWQENISQYADIDLNARFQPDDQRLPAPPEEKIREIMRILGKSDTDEQGCGTCGYPSCREFAIAVARGLAKTDMCLSFSLRNRQEYIKNLKQTNEKLAKTQEALRESERKARQEQQLAREAMETNAAMLQKLPSGLVVADEKLKIIQSNNTFIDILGKEAAEINEIIPGLKGADLKTMLPFPFYNLFTYVLENDDDVVNRDVHYAERMLNVSIFTIRKNKIVGAVIRDMYMPEVRKEEVIRRVGEAIDENLELVQKIAFLLGEGASRTEQILNSIIDFHRSDKK